MQGGMMRRVLSLILIAGVPGIAMALPDRRFLAIRRAGCRPSHAGAALLRSMERARLS